MKTKLATPTVLKKIFDRKIDEVAERKQTATAIGPRACRSGCGSCPRISRVIGTSGCGGGSRGDCRGEEGEPEQRGDS